MDPKKKFGQNFITDTNLINKIVSSSKIDDKNVIEVGPGRGALTKELAKRAKMVIAYEIDKDLTIYLDELVRNNDNLEVIYKDFLSIDFKSDKKWELIGNLPYYITTPILFKFLENNVYNSATIMVQKEVGERLISKPNSKKYNALSVIVQYLTNVERVANVSKKLFFPVPKVDSVVIRLEKKNNREIPLEKEQDFLRFVKACFTQKRKTLANNLTESYNQNKEAINALLRVNQFNESVRAEQLSLNDFINLFNQIIWI